MKKIITLILTLVITSSCVSKKIYQELEEKYNILKNRNQDLVGENDDLFSTTKDLEDTNLKLSKSMDSLQVVKAKLLDDVVALETRKKQLENSYSELSQSSSEELDAKAKEILRLSQELDTKEATLIAENTRLENLQNKLASRSERIQQLEKLIASKETAMQHLKDAVSNALQNFEGNGLTVYKKNGKVYVSMENKLLFSSGSWSVGNQGKSAVIALAKVLKQNKDINVLIEGHTDNAPYNGGNGIDDNWDLSTKRATAIVRILINNAVDAKQVTAAGRSKYLPIDTNNTQQGKAKNRRIEVILAPNLDAISKMLEN
ncbi:MAG: OmpA family protein [Flavobacteriaceae bacterium]|nr:OmpA family protein [Flavobacteriaceae bacterium]